MSREGILGNIDMQNMTVQELEKKLARLEEQGLRNRRGVKLFEKLEAVAGQVIFQSMHSDGGLPSAKASSHLSGHSLDADGIACSASENYKSRYSNSAGCPSWVSMGYGVRTFEQDRAPDFSGEDLDDVARNRGLRRYPAADQKSDVVESLLFGAATKTASLEMNPNHAQVEGYSGLYNGAAGTPSWATPIQRAKQNVSCKLHQEATKLRAELMVRLRKDQARKAARMAPETVDRAPRERFEIGPPASCGMARLAMKKRRQAQSKPKKGELPWSY